MVLHCPCLHHRCRVPMLDIIYRYDAGPTLCCMVLLFVYVLLLGLLVVYGFRQVAVGLMFVRCLWRARRSSLVGIFGGLRCCLVVAPFLFLVVLWVRMVSY